MSDKDGKYIYSYAVCTLSGFRQHKLDDSLQLRLRFEQICNLPVRKPFGADLAAGCVAQTIRPLRDIALYSYLRHRFRERQHHCILSYHLLLSMGLCSNFHTTYQLNSIQTDTKSAKINWFEVSAQYEEIRRAHSVEVMHHMNNLILFYPTQFLKTLHAV